MVDLKVCPHTPTPLTGIGIALQDTLPDPGELATPDPIYSHT